MLEWIIIVGLVVSMYIVLYKYEKKISKLEKKLDEHHKRIDHNHKKINEHDNHIEQMWVTLPKEKKE